jgi:hypothetical protein
MSKVNHMFGISTQGGDSPNCMRISYDNFYRKRFPEVSGYVFGTKKQKLTFLGSHYFYFQI